MSDKHIAPKGKIHTPYAIVSSKESQSELERVISPPVNLVTLQRAKSPSAPEQQPKTTRQDSKSGDPPCCVIGYDVEKELFPSVYNTDPVDEFAKKDESKQEYATLTMPDGKTYKIPVLTPTLGPQGLDIRGLYRDAGVFTYDPGFTTTCSCHSSITFIDGPKGQLLYRGYDIRDLTSKASFEEVTFLLLYGQLPSKKQLMLHNYHLKAHRMVHEKLSQFYKGFKAGAHPMAIMVGVVGALSAFYHDSLDIRDPAQRALSAYRLIAKMPTIAAITYKTAVGQPIVYPDCSLSYAENFLYMMFARPDRPYVVNKNHADYLNKFLILHADHEQNASTSTVRIAGSSMTNPFCAVSSGITALFGPAHGGANEAVIGMLKAIGSKENIPKYIARAKDKNDSFRLMGFGHRVYKNYDPRALYMREAAHKLLAEQKGDESLLSLAIALEKAALKDEYFVKRKLFPNVDFYSGIVLLGIGIPVSMFTVLFAVARTTGWVAQWKEMIENRKHRIGRPRQLYMGASARDFEPCESRKELLSSFPGGLDLWMLTGEIPSGSKVVGGGKSQFSYER